MNYLTGLAERLVTTYEDEENFLEWITFSDRARNRATIISALRVTLESEVSAGRLHISPSRSASDFSDQPLLTAEED